MASWAGSQSPLLEVMARRALGVGEQVFVQGVDEEMGTEPTKAAAVACGEILVEPGRRVGEIPFGVQAGGRGRLGCGGVVFLVEEIADGGVGVLIVGLGIQHAGVGVVPMGSGCPVSMAWRKTKLRRMWRSSERRKAWPLLSMRLSRLVRQKPMRRLPARERSSRIWVSACVGGVVGEGAT